MAEESIYEVSMTPFTRAAKRTVQDYTKVPLNVLADGYCAAKDNGDDEFQDGYMSAIILRFWSKIGKLVAEHPMLFPDYATAFDALTNSILIACKPEYRIWQRSSTNAESAINQVLNKQFIANGYYNLGLQKNGGLKRVEDGGGGGISFVSLDESIDGDEEGDTFGDLVASDTSYLENCLGAHRVVQDLIDNDKLVEAIVIDNVLSGDVFKVDTTKIKTAETSYARNTKVFVASKLVKELNAIDKDYIEHFLKEFNTSEVIMLKAFEDLRKANNTKKYKIISKCQEFLRCHANEYI